MNKKLERRDAIRARKADAAEALEAHVSEALAEVLEMTDEEFTASPLPEDFRELDEAAQRDWLRPLVVAALEAGVDLGALSAEVSEGTPLTEDELEAAGYPRNFHELPQEEKDEIEAALKAAVTSGDEGTPGQFGAVLDADGNELGDGTSIITLPTGGGEALQEAPAEGAETEATEEASEVEAEAASEDVVEDAEGAASDDASTDEVTAED